MPSWDVAGLYSGSYPFDDFSTLDAEIKERRILRSHLCGTDWRCQDPEAHFTGTDEEWQAIIEKAREDHAKRGEVG